MTATRNKTDNTSINRTKIREKTKWEEKQPYEYFYKKKNLDITKKKKKKTLIEKPNQFDSSTEQRHKDCVKATIDKTQQNGCCILCDHREETINHITKRM